VDWIGFDDLCVTGMTSSRTRKKSERFSTPGSCGGTNSGGVAQAIGFALTEKGVWQNGRMINNQMTKYMHADLSGLPPIRVFYEELGNVHGAPWRKGHRRVADGRHAPAI